VLLEKVRQGCTVIMTTHILEVAERMAERIGVISRGKLIAEGTLDELRHQVQSMGAGTKVGDTSLEDVFLTLVADEVPQGSPQESGA
jgi:ABC-2 type transport system ATP-binding protein